MPDGFTVDFSDLHRLAAQMATVDGELPKGLRGAVAHAAYGTKDSWQESLETSDVPASASTIWYEVKAGRATVEATVASTKGSDRLRGYVYAREYGSPTVNPAADAQSALQRNVGDLERGLAIAGENALRRALNR